MLLRERAVALRELMDAPDCDPQMLERTYQQFPTVNRLVAGWGTVYRRQIRPLLSSRSTTRLLDVGCGGGDVARILTRWATRDGLLLDVTGIDPDDRAIAYATHANTDPAVRFEPVSTSDLVGREQFDIVISNHVLHHLTADQLRGLVCDSERLSTRLVVHNDLQRSVIAYAAFFVGATVAGRRSFIRTDGLRSIRRSYRLSELTAAAPEGWQCQPLFPYRLLLTHIPPAR